MWLAEEQELGALIPFSTFYFEWISFYTEDVMAKSQKSGCNSSDGNTPFWYKHHLWADSLLCIIYGDLFRTVADVALRSLPFWSIVHNSEMVTIKGGDPKIGTFVENYVRIWFILKKKNWGEKMKLSVSS